MIERVFVGVGSNVGKTEENCLKAVKEMLRDTRAGFIAQSSLYATSPVSRIAQADFINCALCITWPDNPFELLKLLNDIEYGMGRHRELKDGPRIIDLDILLFGDMILESAVLTIPHPRLHERKFAIIPCLEIDPSLVHPRYRRPLQSFLPGIDDTQRVTLARKAVHGGQ